jgi:RimJ/RimL family protein N-acetyltransferase
VTSAGSNATWWPLWDLRLRYDGLELAPITEADLPAVIAALPADLEQDPAATSYAIDPAVQRSVVVAQTYWRDFGTWRPDAWRLNFLVRRGGVLIGLQELEGNDFPTLRTVDTSSWLVPAARGTGTGKSMRRAVLAMAFGPLGARAAITSAWHDNHASLGVSRSLGYQPNGESFMARDGGVDTLVHLRLTRDEWLAGGVQPDVEIDGFEATRPFFGI